VRPSEFFARELAPSRRRLEEAARNATKTAITTGLAATLQILGPFGSLFVFRIGQPGISLGLTEGVLIIVCAALMQASIVPITGMLLDYPGFILAFLFVVFATIAYLLSNTKLFLILALVAIGTITTVYVGIFRPGSIGWGAVYTFDGILVATIVMVVIDTLIWPSLPEPRLLESIAGDLEQIRERLKVVGEHYLDPSNGNWSRSRVPTILARNLAILKSVKEQTNPTPQRLKTLIDSVTLTERAYLEVGRLAVLCEDFDTGIRTTHRRELEDAFDALDRGFSEKIRHVIAGLDDRFESADWLVDLRLAIQNSGIGGPRPPSSIDAAAPERVNYSGFLRGLEELGNLLEPRAAASIPNVHPIEIEAESEPRAWFDETAFRFSVKLGAALTLGLLVGLTSQRADLQTILWSVLIAGQPNQYGAVVRKTLLRLAGCILGGLAALGSMIVVSQNFDSLIAYLIAIFVVTMISTYIAQSDEWLGYAGIQAGITFLVCYVGLGPTSNVYSPLWRFWGIVLGVLTAGFVFLVLWPEYASDKVTSALARLLKTITDFAKKVAGGDISDAGIAAAERKISSDLLQLLNLADQARLEGSRGSAIAIASIDSASTIVRIGYRFEMLARARIRESPSVSVRELSPSQSSFEAFYCHALEGLLSKLLKRDSADPLAAPQLDFLFEGEIIDLTDIETYHRLPVLLGSLENSLATIVKA
jgi:uncharacterized membrane protein YccC